MRWRNKAGREAERRTTGHVLHWAAHYDLLIWLVTLGSERRFGERLLQPARLKPGESVRDVGCGSGTLAIEARQHVGLVASAHGDDAAYATISRAPRKA